jgi:S4 domain protein YaaA
MEVKIKTEHINLGQFLKHAGIIDTGGQAKEFIVSSEIKVNGILTNQRGKKLYPGDVIKVNDLMFTIVG